MLSLSRLIELKLSPRSVKESPMVARRSVLIAILAMFMQIPQSGCADEELANRAEVRIRTLAGERKRIADQRANERQKLEEMLDLQGWAIKGFDDPLAPNGPRFANRSVDVDRFLERRKRTVSYVVSLPPEKLKGSIASGTGLNALQECLGTAALQHEMFLQKIEDIPEGSRTQAQSERLKVLQEISSELMLPADLLSKIDCYRQGELGKRLPIQLNFRKSVELEVLPLDWPTIFKMYPELFKTNIDNITAAKKACISADEDDYEPAKQLMKAISELEEQVASIQKAQILDQKIELDGKWQEVPMKAPEIQRAKNYVRTLKLVVVKFLESLNLQRVEGYGVQRATSNNEVSVITLLAAMEERSLIFAEENGGRQDTRQRIFSRMREYYGALYALSLEISSQEKEIEYLEGLIDKSFETEQLGMAFDAFRFWLDGR